MKANKVILNGETLIDLTADTVTPDKLAVGATAHDKSGNQITGTLEVGGGEVEVKLQEKNITENGIYTPDAVFDGFSKVNVNVVSGGGGAVTLFTPSISLQSVTSVLTITDDNGAFAQGYNLYANDELITVLTSKTATLTDYIEHTETLEIKVQAVGANFNPSDYAVITWEYVNADGTRGLAYSVIGNGTYAYCTGIGSAIETDIEIAMLYEGVSVRDIYSGAFQNNKNITRVIIPENVANIWGSAFRDCTSLTSVIISGSPYIEYAAFMDCRNLKRVDCSKSTIVPTINTSVFTNTHSTLQIKVPANIIDEWKNATNWCNYADKIVTEFTNEV